jgi:hypothetical protein
MVVGEYTTAGFQGFLCVNVANLSANFTNLFFLAFFGRKVL